MEANALLYLNIFGHDLIKVVYKISNLNNNILSQIMSGRKVYVQRRLSVTVEESKVIYMRKRNKPTKLGPTYLSSNAHVVLDEKY